MKIRRTTSLVVTFQDETPVFTNFLTKQSFSANGTCLEILSRLSDWTDVEELLSQSSYSKKSLAKELGMLIKNGAVVVKETVEANRDEKYKNHWRWGISGGLYHFGLRDSRFMTKTEAMARLEEYKSVRNSPPLLTSNEELEPVFSLPRTNLQDPFFKVLAKRRSRREYSGEPISLQVLADCLFNGNGITEIKDHGKFGVLPKGMTPSGGARNPFELYVYAINVGNLEPGFYHYSAFDHTLGFLHSEETPKPSELLASQTWSDNASAIIFNVATFERSAWKYRGALAYRVVLMESGHITQNILLTASYYGIFAAPTGALTETRIEKLLGLREIEQAAIFATVLGAPDNNSDPDAIIKDDAADPSVDDK